MGNDERRKPIVSFGDIDVLFKTTTQCNSLERLDVCLRTLPCDVSVKGTDRLGSSRSFLEFTFTCSIFRSTPLCLYLKDNPKREVLVPSTTRFQKRFSSFKKFVTELIPHGFVGRIVSTDLLCLSRCSIYIVSSVKWELSFVWNRTRYLEKDMVL